MGNGIGSFVNCVIVTNEEYVVRSWCYNKRCFGSYFIFLLLVEPISWNTVYNKVLKINGTASVSDGVDDSTLIKREITTFRCEYLSVA